MDAAPDRQRARAVAAAATRLAADRGVALPDTLALWSLAGGRPDRAGAVTGGPPPDGAAPATGPAEVADLADAADAAGVADDLASVLEAATSARQRRAAGLHVTPRWVADHLVALALGDGPVTTVTACVGGPNGVGGGGPAEATACDPACGGGAFLLAAARALHARGVPRAEVVRHRLWGADIDPVGLAAAEAELTLWSGGAVPPPGRLVVGDPLRQGAELWPDPPAAGFHLVAGNPPFQNQLGRATTRARDDQRWLRARYGAAVRPYTDTAWLFLLLGCELARPGGRVVLVQPDSVVAARDAAVLRDEVARRAHLAQLWVDERRVFAAAVRVCAPVLHVLGGRAAPATAETADTASGAGPAGATGPRPPAGTAGRAGRWGDLLADAAGVPAVELALTAGRLGDRATVAAGFRDEYYDLVDLVRESGTGAADPADPAVAPLVTAGAIDWGRAAWGRRPQRFAKRRWTAPVVDLDRLAAQGTPAARRWVARTRVPKVVVATQTRVVEAAVDEAGTWVPSVPALAVVPHLAPDLWPVAAALAAPGATAWLLRRRTGAALSRSALKVSARDLAELPLPADGEAWVAAAAALRRYARDPGAAALDDFAAAASAAYRSPPSLLDWWRPRIDPASGRR